MTTIDAYMKNYVFINYIFFETIFKDIFKKNDLGMLIIDQFTLIYVEKQIGVKVLIITPSI